MQKHDLKSIVNKRNPAHNMGFAKMAGDVDYEIFLLLTKFRVRRQ